ncbi:MAG TPA: dTDP-4-dehydrorhamnose reductase [Caulobacteraceae bacterium]
MKALVTGGGGQLAKALVDTARPGWTVTAPTRADMDIDDGEAVTAALDFVRPDVIVNAAAFTAVDRAESEAEAAWRTNRDGAGRLADGAARIGARIVHLSTDFVFDGCSTSPYRPGDATGPLGVYGASKLAGEAAVLASGAQALIVRTAWVYAGSGRNFLTTMLRLMGEGAAIRVVADQVGTPTSAASLARALWALVDLRASGVMHFTDSGVASWYDFALAIAQEGYASGLLTARQVVTPIASADFPTPARRPAFSVLDCRATWTVLGGAPPHWRAGLRRTLNGMRAGR